MAVSIQKDKNSVIQVIGCILNEPMLLLDDKYRFIEEDFPEKFHKIIFSAIEHLVKQGSQELTYITIDDFLSNYPKQYKTFTDNHGMDYLVNCMDNANQGNFEYYYNRLKKFSLLNKLAEKGFETTQIYDPSICDYDEVADMQAKFDSMEIEEIFEVYDKSIIELKDKYSRNNNTVSIQAGYKLRELMEQFTQYPEFGAPMGSSKLTTIARGRRLGTLYMYSSPQGTGKSRISVADACRIAIPTIYDTQTKAWINTQWCQPTLLITTEMSCDEIQTMILAYVSEVQEEKILNGVYDADEKERLYKATQIIEDSPLYIEHLPNFSTEDVENAIKKHKVKNNIKYCFFDYIFTSLSMLKELSKAASGIKALREDNLLLLFATRLKDLSTILNIHIHTSTQVSADWKSSTGIADQTYLRSAKSLSDKTDLGCIILPLQEKDKKNIDSILRKGFMKVPNLVANVYKNRRGTWTQLKVFFYFNHGILRTEDCFVTDQDYKLINIPKTEIQIAGVHE